MLGREQSGPGFTVFLAGSAKAALSAKALVHVLQTLPLDA